MGLKLQKAFRMAIEADGLKAEMRLAMKYGKTSQKASGEPDSPENIKKMEAALRDVIGKEVRL
jgi:hypothetical protein